MSKRSSRRGNYRASAKRRTSSKRKGLPVKGTVIRKPFVYEPPVSLARKIFFSPPLVFTASPTKKATTPKKATTHGKIHRKPSIALRPLARPSVCSSRNIRKHVILATGHGGNNGAKIYKSRSKVSCK